MTQLFKVNAHSVARELQVFIEAETEEEAKINAGKIFPSMVTVHIDDCTPTKFFNELLKKDDQVQPEV